MKRGENPQRQIQAVNGMWLFYLCIEQEIIEIPQYYDIVVPYQNFIDVNGDGLQDYVYSYHTENQSYCAESKFALDPYFGGSVITRCEKSVPYTTMTDVVYLNNGSGWDIAYKCLTKTVEALPATTISKPYDQGGCSIGAYTASNFPGFGQLTKCGAYKLYYYGDCAG
jgi:hypothetical protein